MRNIPVLLGILLSLLISITFMPTSTQEETENPWTTIESQYSYMFDVSLNPDETLLAVVNANPYFQNGERYFDDSAVEVFDLETTERVAEIFSTADRLLYRVAFSPDGAYLAVGYEYGQVEIYETESYEQITMIERAYGGSGNDIMFSPDGQYLIGDIGDTRIISTIDWSIIATSRGTDDESNIHVAVSPDSSQIATTDFGDSLNIHDIETGEIVESFAGLFENTGYLFWNTDETIIYETEREIRVLDLESGDVTVSFAMPDEVIVAMEINPDGTQILISTHNSNTLTLWDIETGEMIMDFPLEIDDSTTIALGNSVVALAEGSTVFFANLEDAE